MVTQNNQKCHRSDTRNFLLVIHRNHQPAETASEINGDFN